MMKKRIFCFIALAIASLMLISCGGKSTPAQEAEDIPAEKEVTSEETQMEQNTSSAEVEEQELPADFPEVFPLPDYAKVASTVDVPGENSFRIFFSFPQVTLEDVLTFYQHELQEGGWSVDAEGPESTGYGMWITHPEYEAALDFIVDEYGVVLDLALAPLGELEEIPGSDQTFGESDGLGEGGGDFPADFPVPSRFSAIDLPAKLADDGYQLAFTFPDLAELAIIELSTALMTGGWEIGDFEVDSMTASYIVPFTGPGGFQGYALITAKPDVAGLSSISGAVIALHPGAIP